MPPGATVPRLGVDLQPPSQPAAYITLSPSSPLVATSARGETLQLATLWTASKPDTNVYHGSLSNLCDRRYASILWYRRRGSLYLVNACKSCL
jgi:hypothetical protein